MQARFVRIAELLVVAGPGRVGMPHVRHLDGISRALYFTAQGQRIVVTRVFIKKTQATPRREIKTTERRMGAWLREQ
jgi:phage-related protein